MAMGMEMLMKSLGVDPQAITDQVQEMGKLIVELHGNQVKQIYSQMRTEEMLRRLCVKTGVDITDIYPNDPRVMITHNTENSNAA